MACGGNCAEKKKVRTSGGKVTVKKKNKTIITTHSKFGKFKVTPTGGKFSYGRV